MSAGLLNQLSVGAGPGAGKGMRPQAMGSYAYPQAPAGVSTIYPTMSGGYYNQMAQNMAGPNYSVPHFNFTGLNASGGQSGSPGGGAGPGNGSFSINGPASGIGTGMGPYAFGGGGSGGLGGLLGGAGDVNGNDFPGSLTIGGGNVTGGYSPSSPMDGMLGGALGGLLGGAPGALIGHVLGTSFGGNSGGLTLPNGQTLPTQNMNLPPTSIPMPQQNIQLAQPIIDPATGSPYGTPYGETSAGQHALNVEQGLSDQAIGTQNSALMAAYLERLHQKQ